MQKQVDARRLPVHRNILGGEPRTHRERAKRMGASVVQIPLEQIHVRFARVRRAEVPHHQLATGFEHAPQSAQQKHEHRILKIPEQAALTDAQGPGLQR